MCYQRILIFFRVTSNVFVLVRPVTLTSITVFGRESVQIDKSFFNSGKLVHHAKEVIDYTKYTVGEIRTVS